METLKDEENEFLEELGMDYDSYNQFAAVYVPKSTDLSDLSENMDPAGNSDRPQNNEPDLDPDPSKPDEGPGSKPSESKSSGFDWPNIPKELWPLITQLTGEEPPK